MSDGTVVPLTAPLPERKSKSKPKPPPGLTEAEREARRIRERERHQRRKAAETKAQQKRRLAKEGRKRKELRARLAEDEDAIFTFKEWCALVGISVRQGRVIVKSGDGPVITDISAHLKGVSRRHHREWQERRSRPRSTP